MKRKLFLSSAGIVPETKEDFLKLLGKDPDDLTVAFIPTAGDPEKDKTFVQWSIDQIKEIGIKFTTIDLKKENKDTLYGKLNKADIIWVNGGNTFYLLDQVRRSGFNQVIEKLLDEGKIYVGVSAGSYLACPTIESAKWKHVGDPDIVGLKDLTALNLVKLLVVAHYEDQFKQDVENGSKTTKLPVITLNDKQAITVIGDEFKIVGDKKNILIFNDLDHLFK